MKTISTTRPTARIGAPTSARRQGANARQREASSGQRRAEERERRLRGAALWTRRLAPVVAAVAVLAGGVLGGRELVLRQGWIALQGVDVRGTGRESAAALGTACGLSMGEPLTALDLDGAKRRLEARPWILSARVRRSFPHRVRVDIIERTPVASLPSGLWVAPDGRLLPPRGERPALELASAWRGGAWLPEALKPAALALDEVSRLAPAVAGRIEDASVASDGTLRLSLRGFHPELLVRPEDWNRSLARAGALERELGAEAATVTRIDLRHGDVAALRTIPGGT